MRRNPGRISSHFRPSAGLSGKELATIFKLADIAVSLDFAPGAKGIKADGEQIGFGTMRKTEPATG